MSVALDIKLDPSSLAEFSRAMQQIEKRGKKTVGAAVRIGTKSLTDTLSGQTRQSAKVRKIVKNPDPKKARLSPYGVMRYRKGKEVFMPLARTGEYGRVRYVDRKTMRVKEWDRTTGEVRYVTFTAKDAPELSMTKNKRRLIKRSGMAKKSWRYAYSSGSSGMNGSISRIVRHAVTVTRRFRGENPYVKISNRLNYVREAFMGSPDQAVSAAFKGAAQSMMHKLNEVWK